MSDIVDGIKDFYDHFIMRDLLSFVTPGAIIVISILLLKYDFSHILDSSKSIPILVYIPIFGLFFMVGFAVQVFGAEILKIIQSIAAKTNLIGMDIVELNPLYDTANTTAINAANFLVQFVSSVFWKEKSKK